jgi:hypothetical protein
MSVRKEVEALLKDAWKNDPVLSAFRVIATERALDDIKEPTALLRIDSVTRLPEAPLSQRTVNIRLTLISPHQDVDLAADELDEAVDAALDYLDKSFSHDEATTVNYGNRLAFDIPLHIIARKDA